MEQVYGVRHLVLAEGWGVRRAPAGAVPKRERGDGRDQRLRAGDEQQDAEDEQQVIVVINTDVLAAEQAAEVIVCAARARP